MRYYLLTDTHTSSYLGSDISALHCVFVFVYIAIFLIMEEIMLCNCTQLFYCTFCFGLSTEDVFLQTCEL